MKLLYKRNLTFLIILFSLFPIKIGYLVYCYSGQAKVIKNITRREIVDSEGNLLATSMKTYSVYYIPYEIIESHEKIAASIAKILNVKPSKIEKRLLLTNKFVWIVRHITPQKANAISSLGYSGIYVTKDCIRFYPLVDLFVHALGRVDDENHGIVGVEKYYNEYLENEKNPPLKLSLKSSFQHILKDELIKGKKRYNAKFVSGLIVCAKTGRILAMFSKNDNKKLDNPHVPTSKLDLNLTTQARYELGSVMKAISAPMFLESKIVDTHTILSVPPYYYIGDHKIRDYGKKHTDYLEMTFKEAFIYSSNIAFVSLADKLTFDQQFDYYSKIGLLESWSIDKVLVQRALRPSKMRKCDISVFSYGYGISLPLATYIRGFLRVVTGKNLSLHIEQNYLPDQSENERLLPFPVVKNIRHLLYTAALQYAPAYDFKGVKVGGKTGTAKKHSSVGYKNNSNLSSYVFVFPVDDPQVLGVVLVDQPSLNNVALYGSQSAMLLALTIVERLLKFYKT